MSPIVLIYGDCQAQTVARVFSQISGFPDDLEFRYVISFEKPIGGWDDTSDIDMRRVVAYWEQIDARTEFAHRDDLRSRIPKNASVCRFPSTYSLALWPFTGIDARNIPELPRFPFGRFPWSDSVAASIAKLGLADDEIYPAYLKLTAEKMPDLDNRLECDILRWRARDELCDVKFGDFILANFRHRRLFWTWGHLAAPITIFTAQKLYEFSGSQLGGDRLQFEQSLTEFERAFNGSDDEQAPLHALVAEHFKLTYFDRDMKYRFYSTSVTEEEYIRRYVKWEPLW